MSRAGGSTPSEYVVWACRLPRSGGISAAPASVERSSPQLLGRLTGRGGGPSQVTAKPNPNQPLTSRHPVFGEPTGVLGERQAAGPPRRLEVGGARRAETPPMNAGSYGTVAPCGYTSPSLGRVASPIPDAVPPGSRSIVTGGVAGAFSISTC